MNDKYRRLKQKYDEVGKQISYLHTEQRKIRELMESVCTHVNTIKIDSDIFLVDVDLEDEETKYKCRDCYRYFTEKEFKNLNSNK